MCRHIPLSILHRVLIVRCLETAPSLRQGASESSEAQMISHCVVSLLVLFERVEVLSSAIKDVIEKHERQVIC